MSSKYDADELLPDILTVPSFVLDATCDRCGVAVPPGGVLRRTSRSIKNMAWNCESCVRGLLASGSSSLPLTVEPE